jgi:hypothetical protein
MSEEEEENTSEVPKCESGLWELNSSGLCLSGMWGWGPRNKTNVLDEFGFCAVDGMQSVNLDRLIKIKIRRFQF